MAIRSSMQWQFYEERFGQFCIAYCYPFSSENFLESHTLSKFEDFNGIITDTLLTDFVKISFPKCVALQIFIQAKSISFCLIFFRHFLGNRRSV